MKKSANYLIILFKDIGVLFLYSLLYISLVGCVQYAFYLINHWDRPGDFPLPLQGPGDLLIDRLAETIVLLAYFAKHRKLQLNYRRILNLQLNKFLNGSMGFGYAALTILFITGIMMALGAVSLIYNPSFSVIEAIIYFLLFISVGFNEEFTMRGIWLEYLLKRHHTITAVTITSLVFAVLHLGNPNITLLAFFNLILAGVTLAQLYLLTRNIWLAAFFHFGWNFFQGPVLGFAVSGLPMHSVFIQPANNTNVLINGGAFGLEGSIIETIVTGTMAIVIGWVLWNSPAKRIAPSTSIA